MICKQCGKTFPENEPLPFTCPQCGTLLDAEDQPVTPEENAPAEENVPEETASQEAAPAEETPAKEAAPEEAASTEEPAPAPKKKGAGVILAALIAAVVLVGAAWWYANGRGEPQTVTAQEHQNPTYACFQSSQSAGVVENGQVTELYVNTAQDLTANQTIGAMIQGTTPYIGVQNYVKWDNGDEVYLEVAATGVESGTPTTEVNLMYKPAGQEAQQVDTGVAAFSCSNGNSVYYYKTGENGIVQYRYDASGITPVSEIIGMDSTLITAVTDDGASYMLTQLDETGTVVQSGYYVNGTAHMLDDSLNVYYLSRDGKTIYILGRDENMTAQMYYLTNTDTEEMLPIASGITELLVYEDTGVMVYLGDTDVSENKNNPIGSIGTFDPSTQQVTKLVDNTTSIVEAFQRDYSWHNENGRDMGPSEILTQTFILPTRLSANELFYTDADGNLMVMDQSGNTLTLCEGLYNVDQYQPSEDIGFLSQAGSYLFWSKGSDVYRYTLGSMSEPEVSALDASLSDKVDNNAQLGYLTTGSGNIMEETSDSVVLKTFDGAQPTSVLEDIGTITLVGLDNDGKNLYFLTEDQSLYSKAIEKRSNPKRIASQVMDAVTTPDGIYYLQQETTVGESGEDTLSTTGTLYYRAWDSGKAIAVKEGVSSLSAIAPSLK